jgi:hypothetical protein
MMLTKEILKKGIKQAIINTFMLKQEASNEEIITKITVIPHLKKLFELLDNNSAPQKFLMEKLEEVVLNIKLKETPTHVESSLLLQIEELVYAPLNAPDEGSSTTFGM